MQKNLKKRRKVKILFITEFFPHTSKIDIHGGVEMRTFLIAKELAKRHFVTVITSRVNNGSLVSNLNGIKVISVGFKRKYVHSGDYLNRFVFIVAALIKSLTVNFDIIEAAGIISFLSALISGIIKRKPRVAFVPDILTSFDYFRTLDQIALKVFERLILRAPWTSYVVISQYVERKLSKIIGKSNKTHIIYCPFDDLAKKNKKLKKTEGPSIVYAGRLVGYKRVSDLLFAISIVKKTVPQVKCFVIGDGPDFQKLKKIARSLNLNHSLMFTGYLKDHDVVMRYIKTSWVFCSPSSYEGFGIATVEAMSVSIPFVLPDSRLNREITQGVGGLFYTLGNIKALSTQILTLFSNGALYRRNLTKNNKRVVKLYNASNIAKQTEDLYTKLIEQTSS